MFVDKFSVLFERRLMRTLCCPFCQYPYHNREVSIDNENSDEMKKTPISLSTNDYWMDQFLSIIGLISGLLFISVVALMATAIIRWDTYYLDLSSNVAIVCFIMIVIGAMTENIHNQFSK